MQRSLIAVGFLNAGYTFYDAEAALDRWIDEHF